MNKQLQVKEKLSYGVGDFSINMVLQTLSFTYLFYLTDVFGLNPALAGLIMLVSKIWDAVTDPFMGSLIDNTRSRWGKKRPYLLFGAFPMGLSFFLLFYNPGLPVELKFLWALFTYMFFCTALTFVNIPYASLTVSMTDDPAERSTLTSWRMGFALTGTLFASVASPLLTNQAFGGGEDGHKWMGLVLGIVCVLVMWITFAGTKEKAARTEGKVQLLKNIGAVFVNTPFLVLSAGCLLIFIALNTLAAVVKYYFVYNLKMPGQEAIGLGVIFVSAIFYLPFLNLLSNRLGKKQVFIGALLIFIVGVIGIFFFGDSLPVLIGLFLIIGIGISAVFLMPWSLLADTVEYSQWRTGIRPEGAIYGYFFFILKGAAAIAGLLVGSLLSLAGYQESTASEILIQPESAIQMIRIMLSLIPAGLIAMGMLILTRYSLTDKRHSEIVRDIEKGIDYRASNYQQI